MSKVVPEGWEQKNIGELVTLKYGKSPKEILSKTGNYPVIGTGGITGYSSSFLHEGGTTVIGRKGSINNPSYIEGPFWAIDTTYYSDNYKGVDPKWFYYSLKAIDLMRYNEASGVPSLNRDTLCAIPLLNPPFAEQQKIATILSSVDNVIEKTRTQIDKLKDLKTGMMQELLTKGIGHTEFKDSLVGRIPKSWDVTTIADIARLTSGGTPNRENVDYWNGDVLWVKTGEVNYQTIFDTEEKITALGLKKSSAKLVPAGAILIAMYGQGITRGKVAMLGVPAAMNQACLAIIPNIQVVNDFLYYFLSREYFNLRSMVQEGAQKNLSASIVKEILLPIPSKKEQQKIVQVLKSVDIRLADIKQKKKKLEMMRKSLMQDLLTGEKRV